MNENELNLMIKSGVSDIQVFDQKSLDVAGEILVKIKTISKEVKEYWSEPKKKASEAHKEICKKEREMLDRLESEERNIKRKIADYTDIENRRIKAEEERKRAEAEKMMQLAAEAEEIGDSELAAEAVLESAMATNNVSFGPKTAGISSKKVWRFRIVNPQAVPDQYKMVNEQLIAAIAKGFKDSVSLPIPGVEFFQETIISARTK